MDTTSAISGIQSLGSNVPHRPSTALAGEGARGAETPPSGAALAGVQTVEAPDSAEKSGLSDPGRHPDGKEVADAVKNMNDFMQMVRRTLQFSTDEDSGEMVVQVKDQETGKVIRQIPPEFMLKLAEQMDKFKGLLFEEKA